MRLLIDIGNSRLKWSILHEGELSAQRALVYKQDSLTEQFELEWGQLATPTSVHMISVASGELAEKIADWVEKRWACRLECLQTAVQHAGVTNGYKQPERLGVDRWMAIIAAFNLVGSSVCVVDCGTALTCDAVDSTGKHLGGVIVPGQHMMRRSLLDMTAGIVLDGASGQDVTWGRDTTACVVSGGIHAAVGLIERMAKVLQAELEAPVMIVLTGGDAESLLPWLSFPCRYEADLVLQGIACTIMEQRG